MRKNSRFDMNRQDFMRSELPYGVRKYANGAMELFNRKYEVIARKGPEPEGRQTFQGYYYNDSNPPWRSEESRLKCESVWRWWWSLP